MGELRRNGRIMSNNLFSEHIRYFAKVNQDIEHKIGDLIWWTNAQETVSRINPPERSNLPVGRKLEHPLRRGRGLTYLIKC